MPRFILIDPWLADVGGHNFQYALDVVQSAEEQGYQPVLAVNRSLPLTTRLPGSWTIWRLFHFGMCSRYWLGPDGRHPYPFDLDGKMLGGVPIGALSRLKDVFARFDRRRRILDLARGCSELCDKAQPTNDDLLYLPSMSEADFIGVVRFLRDDPRSAGFIWHLQFHFNILSGRDPEFGEQGATLRRIQRHFRAALDQIPDHQLRFYATTDPMSRQFSRLGVAKFVTLPYPVRDLSKKKPPAHNRPLRVTFAGAMRREKGKKKFGSLIAAVWPDCLANRRMQFVFQAPPTQVARWLPRNLRSQIAIASPNSQDEIAPLRTVKHPLDAQAYHDLIRRTDLGLFLYDSRRYFARASGILCEMLAAGIPAIVPAGCWLADQISPAMYQHVASLCTSDFAQDSQELKLESTASGRQASYPLPHSASDIAIQFQCPQEMPAGTYFEVTTEFEEDNPSSSCHRNQFVVSPTSHLRVPDDNRDISPPPIGLIVPVPPRANRVRVSLQWAYHRDPLEIDSLRVTTLRSPEGHDHHPRGRVGLIFTSHDDIPELLREAYRDYEHYRQTAEQFAPSWLESHHPDRTIEILEAYQLAGRSLVSPSGELSWKHEVQAKEP